MIPKALDQTDMLTATRTMENDCAMLIRCLIQTGQSVPTAPIKLGGDVVEYYSKLCHFHGQLTALVGSPTATSSASLPPSTAAAAQSAVVDALTPAEIQALTWTEKAQLAGSHMTPAQCRAQIAWRAMTPTQKVLHRRGATSLEDLKAKFKSGAIKPPPD